MTTTKFQTLEDALTEIRGWNTEAEATGWRWRPIHEVTYNECNRSFLSITIPEWKQRGMVNVALPMWAILYDGEKDKSGPFGFVWKTKPSTIPGVHDIIGVECEFLETKLDCIETMNVLGYTQLSKNQVQDAATLLLECFGCHHMVFGCFQEFR